MDIKIVPATRENLALVAAGMRTDDQQECWRNGYTPEAAVLWSAKDSNLNAVCMVNGAPLGAYGLNTKKDPVIGYPWVLTTALVEDYKKTFMRASQEIVADMLSRRPILQLYVDAKHYRALRWAQWLGFKIGPEFEYGPLKARFVQIVKTAERTKMPLIVPASIGVH